jgi:hypothetical protein
MKKMKAFLKLIKPLDSVIYFNIALFLSALFQIKSQKAEVVIIMSILGFLNLLYLILTMNLRYQLHKKLLEDIAKEAQLEEKAIKDGNDDFIKLKQEMLENRVLAELKQERPTARFIQNAYIPKQGNEFTEIDILMIDRTGIYIIEVKNLAGKIVGNWAIDEYLKVEHPNGRTYNLYNPVIQNTNHYKNLKNVSGLESKLFKSIIVFGDHTLFDYKTAPIFARICQIKSLMFNIEKAALLNPIVIEEHQIEQIYTTLNKYLGKNKEKAEQHIINLSEYQD